MIIEMTKTEMARKIAEQIAKHYVEDRGNEWIICLYDDGRIDRQPCCVDQSDVVLIFHGTHDGPAALGIDDPDYDTQKYWDNGGIDDLTEAFLDCWIDEAERDRQRYYDTDFCLDFN